MTELERQIAVKLRTLTWWSLDEIAQAVSPNTAYQIRSALYRTFVREGVNTIHKKEKEKKFKEYDPGYIHIDAT